jgi:hypothetical protein
MTDETATAQKTERRLAALEAEVARLRADVDLLVAERDGLIKVRDEERERIKAELAWPCPSECETGDTRGESE